MQEEEWRECKADNALQAVYLLGNDNRLASMDLQGWPVKLSTWAEEACGSGRPIK